MTLDQFVNFIQATVNQCDQENNYKSETTIITEPGKVYTRIVRKQPHSNSVYCFVRNQDGTIFGAKSYKAPDTKHPRGTLANFSDDILTHYGLAYIAKHHHNYRPKTYPTRPTA